MEFKRPALSPFDSGCNHSTVPVVVKYLIFRIATVLIFLLIIEILASIFLLVSPLSQRLLFRGLDRSSQAFLDPVKALDRWAKPPEDGVKYYTWALVHPYFGYLDSRSRIDDNNHGFFSGIDYPYQKKDGDFVVGIFGGSVGLMLYKYAARTGIFEQLLKQDPDYSGKKIVLLNFANGGHKQPQQFFIFSYYLRSLDLALTIDGLNEVNTETNPGLPAEYPDRGGLYKLTREQLDGPALKLISKIQLQRECAEKLAGLADTTRFSSFLNLFIGLLVRLFDNLAYANAIEIEAHLYRRVNSSFGGAIAHGEERENRKRTIWENYMIDMDSLARHYGVKIVHFLQPNQYFIDAKSFSAEEKRIAIDEKQIEPIRQRLSPLIKIVAKLRNAGMNIEDLSQMFSGVEEPIFIDSCCHLNDYGNRLLTQRIVESILKLGNTGKRPK